MKIKSTLYIILFILGALTNSIGQDEPINDLNQTISIEASNITIAELLDEIGKKAFIKFSYNPKLIRATKRVSVRGEKKTVREILNEVFNGEFAYKLRGSYVIIAEKQLVDSNTNVKSALITGYVVDDETLDGLANVSIYTSAGESSMTDEIGAFEIKLKKEDNSTIELRKKDYEPLSFETQTSTSNNLQIKLRPIKSLSVELTRDSLVKVDLPIEYKELKTMYKVNENLQLNIENIQDTLYKPLSFSLYPGISTYGNLSGNIVFNFALNFVGYNRGITGTEIGLFSNINRENVSGVQLAGLSNYTGGDVSGFQAAGIFNMVNQDLEGVQMAGITNLNLGSVVGSQFAGINNHVSKDMDGLQMAGIFNKSRRIEGGQVAGIANMARENSGIQIAGITNLSKKVKGVQIAGICNLVDTINGAQISGVLNVARYVKGNQFGLFNVADSVSGISFGLINLVKKGYKRVEVGADELFPINVSVKTGVSRFYTILTAGMQPDVFDNESSFYTFGLGIGTSGRISDALNIDVNIVNRHITKKSFTDQISFNLKGYLGLELKVFDSFSVFGGASYNAFYFDRILLEDDDFNSLRESYLIDTSDNQGDEIIWRSWIGYSFGARFIF